MRETAKALVYGPSRGRTVPRVPGDKPLLVVNPAAGGGRCGRTFPAVRDVVERRLGAVDVVTTERSGHAIEARARRVHRPGEAASWPSGGDGTLNEVVNGVLGSDRSADVRVGFVGQGTGGDFRRSLGIAHRLDAYVDALASGRERALDVGAARFRGHDGTPQRRWFLNILSVGMSGLVDRFVAESPRVLGGKAAYYLASVEGARPQRASAPRLPGGPRRVLALGRGRHLPPGHLQRRLLWRRDERRPHGGPRRRPLRGRLHRRPEQARFPRLHARKIYDGGHLRLPGVTHFACDRIGIDLAAGRAQDAFLLDVDGEPLGGLPLEVEIVSKALRFLA